MKPQDMKKEKHHKGDRVKIAEKTLKDFSIEEYDENGRYCIFWQNTVFKNVDDFVKYAKNAMGKDCQNLCMFIYEQCDGDFMKIKLDEDYINKKYIGKNFSEMKVFKCKEV